MWKFFSIRIVQQNLIHCGKFGNEVNHKDKRFFGLWNCPHIYEMNVSQKVYIFIKFTQRREKNCFSQEVVKKKLERITFFFPVFWRKYVHKKSFFIYLFQRKMKEKSFCKYRMTMNDLTIHIYRYIQYIMYKSQCYM